MVGGVAYQRTDGRCYGIRITDDAGAYDSAYDFWEKQMYDKRASHSSCAMKRGEDALHPDANYSAQAYIAMLDPAPTGSENHTYLIDRRTEYRTAQAVVVIATDA